MSNSQHADKLGEGPRAWNAWRRENPAVVPDLNDLNLSVGRRQFGSVQGGPIDLSGAELCRADLEHATLIEADLKSAALILADLSHARMTRADLRDANLSHAQLDHADLKDARLDAANLCGTQLRHARNLTQDQIDRAHGDASTALPPHLATPKAWPNDEQAQPAQLANRVYPKIDPKTDPFAILGVKYGASMPEARTAYLRLVKELHPDGRFDDPVANERLKTINKAYHDLKMLKRRADAGKAERGFARRPKSMFVAGFAASAIVIAAALAGLHHAGYFAQTAVRPATPAAERAEAASPNDVTTGSISEHQKSRSTTHDVQEAAAAQLEAARRRSIRDAADDAAWAEAEREGTSVSLHRYLGRHPEGRHAGRATEDLAAVVNSEVVLDKNYDRRDELSAQAAKLALRRYLDAYPNTRFAAEVRSKLRAIDEAEATLLADNAVWTQAVPIATDAALPPTVAAQAHGDNGASARQDIAVAAAAEPQQRDDAIASADVEQTAAAQQRMALLEAAAPATAESEGARDDADWAKAQRRNTKASYAAYLGAYPNGRHAKAARTSTAELEGVTAKAGPVADTKGPKQRPPAMRTGTLDAPASQRWPSADEPFIGADGRIRQR